MRSDFVEPRYEDLALVNLLPSVMATLDGGVPTIPLPRASKYVVLLVDGLGWHQLLEHADHAETMAAMSRGSTRITCSVPSTWSLAYEATCAPMAFIRSAGVGPASAGAAAGSVSSGPALTT